MFGGHFQISGAGSGNWEADYRQRWEDTEATVARICETITTGKATLKRASETYMGSVESLTIKLCTGNCVQLGEEQPPRKDHPGVVSSMIPGAHTGLLLTPEERPPKHNV